MAPGGAEAPERSSDRVVTDHEGGHRRRAGRQLLDHDELVAEVALVLRRSDAQNSDAGQAVVEEVIELLRLVEAPGPFVRRLPLHHGPYGPAQFGPLGGVGGRIGDGAGRVGHCKGHAHGWWLSEGGRRRHPAGPLGGTELQCRSYGRPQQATVTASPMPSAKPQKTAE